jgi:hypothetical protein
VAVATESRSLHKPSAELESCSSSFSSIYLCRKYESKMNAMPAQLLTATVHATAACGQVMIAPFPLPE